MGFKQDFQEADKVRLVIDAALILAVLFMAFQFTEYRTAMEEEGCRYYYESYVPGFEYDGGQFVNSSEYQEAEEYEQERRESYQDPEPVP